MGFWCTVSERKIAKFLAFAATLAAVILMDVGKETKSGPVTLSNTNLPPINVEAQAKFFMVVNIAACVYSALSLILAINNRYHPAVMNLDLIVLSLLCFANGASIVGVLGYYGNSLTQWNKVCSAIIFSLFAAHMFLLILTRAVMRLHRRCR
ncbi:hypothetical protein MKX01_007069 [Papaver californicum]|nr:hypothetical protein MKX01_007069 [Papaver californicum]